MTDPIQTSSTSPTENLVVKTAKGHESPTVAMTRSNQFLTLIVNTTHDGWAQCLMDVSVTAPQFAK